ncbi:MAG: protein kinase, partial [Deltaproteobacteria bacterium]|nr:protein kinase [Deltaproteobacteria bacterium]
MRRSALGWAGTVMARDESTASPTGAAAGAASPSRRVTFPFEPGQTVDNFEIVRVLGRGGMGEVYLARDTQLGRRAALKVVRPEHLGSHRTIADFLNEARLTAKFSHPNIITIHAVGEHGGCPYVALEYLDGHDLKERLAERRLSFQEALRIAISITSALTEAHRHGVLHLDLKPANVFIPVDGRVRVMDFGLARTIQPAERAEPDGPDVAASAAAPQAASGEAWGTPNYTAPEQWMRKPTSAATDIWALGVMLFELCTNRVPYEQTVIVEKGRAICSHNPAPRVDEQANVPAELSDLIARCLEKDPGKRPTAEEAREILDDLLEHRRERVSIEESPFRGLLPYTHRHTGMFFGRESEIAAFVERIRLHPVLAVVGGPGVGKTSFLRAGVIPRLSEQEPWLVIRMRPGSRPFQALASRLRRPEAPIGPAATGSASPGAGSLPEAVSGSQTTRGRPSGRRSMPSHPAPSDPRQSFPSNPLGLPPQPLSAGADPAALDDIAQLAAELFASPGRLSLLLRGLAEDFGCKVLLVVHNIEELFTAVPGRGEISADERRGRFLRAVCTACRDAGDPVRVVLAGRDDYLGRLASFRVVRPALTQVMVLEPLGTDALERMLGRQVRSVGYRFEDEDMAREMAAAVGGATNGLPLLQFAAQQLWEHRDSDRHVLLRSAYEAMGGVEGAVAKHADGVLDALSVEELELARKLLLRLVTPNRQRKVVSRARALDGFGDAAAEQGGSSASAQEVLSRLTQARLVSVVKRRGATEEEATVALAHDALIHTWSTLSRWIDASKEGLARLAELEQAAELWQQQSRNPAHLLAADPLRDATRLLATITAEPPDRVVAFVGESQSRQQRILRRRRLAIGSAIGLSLLVASGALLVAWVIAEKEREALTQRDRARDQRAEALRESARAALGQRRLLEARAKLRVALTEKDSAAARALWWRLRAEPMVWRKDLGALVYQVSFSPDGRTVATACMDGSIYLFDVHTHAQRVLRGHADQVAAVAFSSDGRRLVSSSYDHSVRTWDVETGQQQRVFEGHTGKVWAVAFSPDGELVASSSSDRDVRLWRAATGELVHQLGGHRSEVYAVSFSPDGKVVASGSNDKTIRLWDVASGASRR